MAELNSTNEFEFQKLKKELNQLIENKIENQNNKIKELEKR